MVGFRIGFTLAKSGRPVVIRDRWSGVSPEPEDKVKDKKPKDKKKKSSRRRSSSSREVRRSRRKRRRDRSTSSSESSSSEDRRTRKRRKRLKKAKETAAAIRESITSELPLVPGEYVEIFGLKSAAYLNGLMGCLVDFESDRWVVQLDAGADDDFLDNMNRAKKIMVEKQRVKVKRANLKKLSPEDVEKRKQVQKDEHYKTYLEKLKRHEDAIEQKSSANPTPTKKVVEDRNDVEVKKKQKLVFGGPTSIPEPSREKDMLRGPRPQPLPRPRQMPFPGYGFNPYLGRPVFPGVTPFIPAGVPGMAPAAVPEKPKPQYIDFSSTAPATKPEVSKKPDPDTPKTSQEIPRAGSPTELPKGATRPNAAANGAPTHAPPASAVPRAIPIPQPIPRATMPYPAPFVAPYGMMPPQMHHSYAAMAGMPMQMGGLPGQPVIQHHPQQVAQQPQLAPQPQLPQPQLAPQRPPPASLPTPAAVMAQQPPPQQPAMIPQAVLPQASTTQTPSMSTRDDETVSSASAAPTIVEETMDMSSDSEPEPLVPGMKISFGMKMKKVTPKKKKAKHLAFALNAMEAKHKPIRAKTYLDDEKAFWSRKIKETKDTLEKTQPMDSMINEPQPVPSQAMNMPLLLVTKKNKEDKETPKRKEPKPEKKVTPPTGPKQKTIAEMLNESSR